MSRAVDDGTGVKRHLSGWKRDRPHFGDRSFSAPSAIQPAAADLPLAPKVPVYDQGQLGSCTANMGCMMFRYLEVHAGREPLDISRMSLYKFTRELDGVPLSEDSGAEIRDVMRALRKYGVAPEADDPYIDDGRQFTLPPTEREKSDALHHQALFYYRIVDLHTIKASILQGFPVGFGFTVYESMMTNSVAHSGLVPFPADNEEADGGHAVTIIGYDNHKSVGNETGALHVRNSWGTGWGEGGNFWLPYAYVTAGLATDFWTLRSVEL